MQCESPASCSSRDIEEVGILKMSEISTATSLRVKLWRTGVEEISYSLYLGRWSFSSGMRKRDRRGAWVKSGLD